MSYTQSIRAALTDLAEGDPTFAMGLLDYYVNEKQVSLPRILDILERRFHIPKYALIGTLQKLF